MNLFRKALVAIKGDNVYHYSKVNLSMSDGKAIQDIIFNMLSSDHPCLLARFGSVELQAVVDYLCPPTLRNAYRFVKGKAPSWGYAPSTMRTMRINAGFFPATKPMLDRFGKLMLECMPMVDMLGSWRLGSVEELSLKQQPPRFYIKIIRMV